MPPSTMVGTSSRLTTAASAWPSAPAAPGSAAATESSDLTPASRRIASRPAYCSRQPSAPQRQARPSGRPGGGPGAPPPPPAPPAVQHAVEHQARADADLAGDVHEARGAAVGPQFAQRGQVRLVVDG